MRMIIPFLVFCLVATCNAELRTWTAVNGKEVEAEFVSSEKGIVELNPLNSIRPVGYIKTESDTDAK